MYLNTRGCELPGSHNYVLLAELFREQSSPWEPLAKSHIRDIFTAVTQWIKDAVSKTVPETNIQREILSIGLLWLEDTEVRAAEELGKLLADDRRHPITYNHYYTDNVQKDRHDRIIGPVQDALQNTLKLITSSNANGSNDGYTKSISAIERKIIVDMDQQACSEALICLNAYYKVSNVSSIPVTSPSSRERPY